jgi:TM2 domain-containing membrane protein YozV
MDCVNHSGVAATAFCQNCGKALCAQCIRHGAGGQILCEPCWMAWQAVPNPFAVPPPAAGPNPATAAVLGLIPGVGAMYNGQFFKGLIHVVIFAVLISITDHYPIFGLFIAAWIFYQSFEAFHTAKARRDGLPLPDPLGLNEVGNWLNLGGRGQHPGAGPWGTPPTGPAAPGFVPGSGPVSGTGFVAGPGPANPGANPSGIPGAYPPPYPGYQPPYPPPPGFIDPAAPPVAPPPPPPYWRRREPIGAVVLIALGLLFLLGQLDLFSSYIFRFSWPLILIGLGVWLMISRMGSQGGSR